MYAIIVGAGRAVEAIAAWLINAGHEVTVVDRSVAKCESLEALPSLAMALNMES